MRLRSFERELRRREAALRAAEVVAFETPEAATLTIPADAAPFEEGTEVVLVEHPRGAPWVCDFCGREFHGYPSLLNHRCDEGIRGR